MAKAACAVLFVATAIAPPGLADVLVTTSGSRYEGQVVDQGDSYLVRRPNGGKITFPKSMVKEVIKSDTPTTQPSGKKAEKLLAPLREKVISVKRDVLEAMKADQEAQKQEIDQSVSAEDQAAIKYAEQYLQIVRQLVAKLGQPAGLETPGLTNARVIAVRTSLKKSDGSTEDIVVTPQNAKNAVAAAEKRLSAARARAKGNARKKLRSAHQARTKSYQGLVRQVAEVENSLRAAKQAIAPVADDPVKAKAELAKWQEQIEGSLKVVMKGLADARAGKVGQPAATTQPSGGGPATRS
ncbi:MAG TPA: hypothetical protein VM098_03605 [Phycisphaerae bacterium]|nr:hypothetical protein [Phycisphaerae bacterium]